MLIAPDAQARWPGSTAAAKLDLEPVHPDPDAVYERSVTIDVSALEPIVVVPPSPANTRNLSEHLGLEVHTGYLGSCASGRIEDLRAAADVLRGRQVKPGFQLHVVPTSQAIMAQAAREGLIECLVEAGAFISSPTCDYCYGRIATMADGQRAVSTGTLNTPGRMGSVDSEIYLCNAAVVAASAIEGRIADPRPYLEARAMSTLPNLRGRVAWIFDEDDFDIDLIIGVRNIKITDVDELARLAMVDRAPDFAAGVQRGDLLVGGRNFGYGHPHYPAMRAMRHLGIAGVIAESFSPGFFRGEIAMGFPLVTCPGIVAAVARGDEVEVDWAAAAGAPARPAAQRCRCSRCRLPSAERSKPAD